jgi:hypothetical protein
MPAWAPVRLIAATPSAWSAMETSVALWCSAGRQQHVQLARVGLLVDRGGQRQQLVRGVAHRGDDDAQVGASGTGPGDPARDAADPVGVRHGRAAELHDDERV